MRDDNLEAMVMTLKKQIEELKGELVICKAALGNKVLAATPKPKVDVSKKKEFKEMSSSRDVDNLLWGNGAILSC